MVMKSTNWKADHINLITTGDVEGAIKLKAKHMPDRLFKYFSLDKFRKEKLEGLAMDYVWLSSVVNQNDVYDSVMYYDRRKVSRHVIHQNFEEFVRRVTEKEPFSAEELELIKNADDPMAELTECLIEKHPEQEQRIRLAVSLMSQVTKELEDVALKRFNDTIRSSLRITCFSESHDSPSMWERYAGNHSGYCVEYNFPEQGITDLRNRCMNPVTYNDQRFDATPFVTQGAGTVILMAMVASLHKGTTWAAEKEWRLVIPGGLVAADTNYMMPTPTAIFLGMNIDEKNKTAIAAIATMKKIPVYRMETSLDSLQMVAQPLY